MPVVVGAYSSTRFPTTTAANPSCISLPRRSRQVPQPPPVLCVLALRPPPPFLMNSRRLPKPSSAGTGVPVSADRSRSAPFGLPKSVEANAVDPWVSWTQATTWPSSVRFAKTSTLPSPPCTTPICGRTGSSRTSVGPDQDEPSALDFQVCRRPPKTAKACRLPSAFVATCTSDVGYLVYIR